MTINRSGELELRNQAYPDKLLQFRIREDGNEVRLDTPRTHVVLRDDDGGITEQDVTVKCTNANVQASGNASVDAGGNLDLQAGGNASLSAAGKKGDRHQLLVVTL